MPASLYVDRSSPLHRLNPVTKLVLLLTLLVIVFAVPFWWVAASVVVLIVIPAAAISGCGRRIARFGLTILTPIIVVLFLVQGLTFPGGTTSIWSWWVLNLTTEGLMFALGIGTRIISLVLTSMLFVLTTHPGKLLSALTERGLSPKFAYIISATLQLIPAFQDRASGILLAQQARGLAIGGGVRGRIRAMMPLLAPLVLGMFTDVEERSTAMEARGFGSAAKRTALVPVPDSAAQRVVRWTMPLVMAAAVVAPHLVGAL
jgi:energy-coupling factor transport system permease protein